MTMAGDPRDRDALERAEVALARWLGEMEGPGGPWEAGPTSSSDMVAIAAVPDADVSLVRLALLRRVTESDLGTAESRPGNLRAVLARRGGMPDPAVTTAELRLCHPAIDLGPGISLAWMRIPLYDPIIADLERLDPTKVTPDLVSEIARAAELLSGDVGSEPTAVDRRPAFVDFLTRLGSGVLPALAFDAGDAYGRTMRTLLATDAALAGELGRLYSLLNEATGVLPGPRWRSRAVETLADPPVGGTVGSTTTRSLRPLLDVDLPRALPTGPGALRPTNQRLVRGLLWLAMQADPAQSAPLIGSIGLRLGTSGRNDSVALDPAIAGTCAALLGEVGTTAAAQELGRMRARVRNRSVAKRIDAALETIAVGSGRSPATVLEDAVPDHGLDRDGHRRLTIGTWTADVDLSVDGRVSVAWSDGESVVRRGPSPALQETHPGKVAEVRDLAKRLTATFAEQRRAIDRRLASARSLPIQRWMGLYVDHPVGRVFGQRQIWRFETDGASVDGRADGAVIAGVDGRSVATEPSTRVRLWHPVEADASIVASWRQRIAEDGLGQPVDQVDRHVYRAPSDDDATIDRRFAGLPLDVPRARALARSRGWTSTALGPWDSGDATIVALVYAEDHLRAEFALRAHHPAADRAIGIAHSGGVWFVDLRTDPPMSITLRRVPVRVFSEAMRDVDLMVSIADSARSAPGHDR